MKYNTATISMLSALGVAALASCSSSEYNASLEAYYPAYSPVIKRVAVMDNRTVVVGAPQQSAQAPVQTVTVAAAPAPAPVVVKSAPVQVAAPAPVIVQAAPAAPAPVVVKAAPVQKTVVVQQATPTRTVIIEQPTQVKRVVETQGAKKTDYPVMPSLGRGTRRY